MSKNKNRRRAQKEKRTLDPVTRSIVDRAGTSAGSKHKSGTDYNRKPKHRNRGWED